MKERHRIPDLEVRPRRIFTEEQVRGHVADFIAQGGVITQCANRIGDPPNPMRFNAMKAVSVWTNERRRQKSEMCKAKKIWETRKNVSKKPTEEQ